MKTISNTLLAALILLIISGCDELLVRDISTEQVEVLAPAPDAVLADGAVIFSWQALEAAEYYRLIVESSSTGALADTLLTSSRFAVETPLPPGAYRWRIQAFNEEYRTSWQTYTLHIIEPPVEITP